MITKKQKFEAIAKILKENKANEELIECVEKEIESLVWRDIRQKTRVSEKKKENLELCNEIDKVMSEEPERLYSLDEIIANVPVCRNFSVQKISALMTMLVNTNKILRFKDKRKTFFQKKVA